MDSLSRQPSVETIEASGLDIAAFVEDAAFAPGVVVECVDAADLPEYREAWADLSARALDPNVFLTPSFALPLLQHVVGRRSLKLLLIWEDRGPALLDRLLGLFPLELPRLRHPAACARIFTHEQICCGTPLVDRRHAALVFEAVMGWLGSHPGRPGALILAGIGHDGPFAAAVASFCADTSRRLAALREWERAVLLRRDGPTIGLASFASAKRRKERARQARRLSEAGLRTYVSARSPAEVVAAAERFLALEHKGWKGSRGSSLLADPARATFLRTMTRLMAEEGRCRIDAIEIDREPVAMGIVLSEDDRAYFWKTTFDEAYAPFSPGVQLTLELTRSQLADRSVAMTDSCAVAKHPMIDRLWPDRAAVADLMVAVQPGDDSGFERCLRLERMRRGLRDRAKALWLKLRRPHGD